MDSSARLKLIRSTQIAMLARGYSAAGVDDICRDAGVSKGSFYHQFPSKEDLAIAALGDFYETGLKNLLAIDLSGAPPERQLLAFLDAIARQGHDFWKSGCLIGALATEMALTSPALQAEVSRLFSETATTLEPLVEPFVASLRGKAPSAAALAEHFLVVVEGAIVISRAHNDPMKINQAVARFAEQLRWLPLRKAGSIKQAPPKREKR